MTDDDYRHREHDHLIEPVFGGLGVEPRAEPEAAGEGAPAPVPRKAGLWRRLTALVARCRARLRRDA